MYNRLNAQVSRPCEISIRAVAHIVANMYIIPATCSQVNGYAERIKEEIISLRNGHDGECKIIASLEIVRKTELTANNGRQRNICRESLNMFAKSRANGIFATTAFAKFN